MRTYAGLPEVGKHCLLEGETHSRLLWLWSLRGPKQGLCKTKRTGKQCSSTSLKILQQKLKNYLTKWEDISCSGIGRLKTVKMAIVPKAISRFNTTPMKIPTNFFGNGKADPQIPTELKEALNSQMTLKKNEVWGLTFSDFKTYYEATVIKLAACDTGIGQTHRSVEQNRKSRNKPIHLWPIDF